MKLATPCIGKLAKKVVVGRLTRHLCVILIDQETCLGRLQILELFAVDVLTPAARDQSVFTCRLGLPKGAALVAMLSSRGQFAFHLIRPDDGNIEVSILL